MFRRSKSEDKAKLEYKLYLARENPEPIFDLSDCNLLEVPQGIYSLCRVFLKDTLKLANNCLSSLSGGGQLKDLHLLKILDIRNNAFTNLPADIQFLKNLKELYVSHNQLKKLPYTISNLYNLIILDVSHNNLIELNENIGSLTFLAHLKLNGNKHLKHLPKTMCKNQNLVNLELDIENFVYPPRNVIKKGIGEIVKYICEDTGYLYHETERNVIREKSIASDNDEFQEKIWMLESIKNRKIQEFIEIEKANDLLYQQEFELANAQKLNKEKLLADINSQQIQLNEQLSKIQKNREIERFKLIEQIQETEQNVDIAIKQLLSLNREPLNQLLEQEKYEEEKLITTLNKYDNTLRKNDILSAMENIIEQETEFFQKYHTSRMESSKTILEEELEMDNYLSRLLEDQESSKLELVAKLREDSYLQKVAVGTLLERGDARSWSLVQQVRLVESQLAGLTSLEIERRKLEIDNQLNDLAEKRINLSSLLTELLQQQEERRKQLISTLKNMDDNKEMNKDFWLKQYQKLLENLPEGLSKAQKNLDPALAQVLLLNGVIHCLPFLAKITQCQYSLDDITENDLMEAGIKNRNDRLRVLDAFHKYEKTMEVFNKPSAPSLALIEEASAPPPETTSFDTHDCVVCLDRNCQIVFIPCGHLCCCYDCSVLVIECPLCRLGIERKIRIIMA